MDELTTSKLADEPVDTPTPAPRTEDTSRLPSPTAEPSPANDPLLSARIEATTALVVAVYIADLDRAPTAPELEGWKAAIDGGLTSGAFRDTVAASEEYSVGERRRATERRIELSGLFDPAWYLATYPDIAAAGLDPLSHFAEHGLWEGRSPNAYLNSAWYRTTQDLPAEVDIVQHYVEIGEPEGLEPGPDFDPAWYRAVHGVPDDQNALAHFLRRRVGEGIAPCPRLWGARGLRQDLPAGHDAFSAFLLSAAPGDFPPTPDLELIHRAGVFDENYYALHSNDVLDAGVDPLEHFCRFGWKEGRDPNFYFKIRWYADTNPEGGRLGINPLVHYLLLGEAAGRRPVVYFDPVWYRETYGVSTEQSALAHFLANRRGQKVSPTPLFDPIWYLEHCSTNIHPRRDPFSHFLIAGMQSDVAPSPSFDPAAWRKRTRGRQSRHFRNLLSPERDNPLIN